MASEHATRTIAPLYTWRSSIIASDLTPVVRHVLLTLSLYMNEVGGSAYPGSARLAKNTGLHQTTVKRALGDAVRNGYLLIVSRGGAPLGGKRLATEYKASSPDHQLPDWGSTDRGHTTTGSGGVTDRGSTVHAPVAQGDPISSLNSPMNLGGSAPKDCLRCQGRGSYWDGMTQRTCDPHLIETEPAAPPPWLALGITREEWLKSEPASLGSGENK